MIIRYRILKKLKFNYEIIKPNQYTKLIDFLDCISEYSIFHKLVLRGNREAVSLLERQGSRRESASFAIYIKASISFLIHLRHFCCLVKYRRVK